jgi:surfeit locus 1 family protein
MRVAQYEFKPALVPSLVFAMILPLLLGLGFWQLDRAEQKQQILSERQARQAETTLALNNRYALSADDRYLPAEATGRYLGERHWLLDNRVVESQAGYHVYTLFELEGPRDRLLAVNRGWVSTGGTREFLPSVPAPEGMMTVRGRLDRPASVGLELDVGDLAGVASTMVVQHLDLADLGAALGREVLPLALVLDEGQPGVLRRDWAPAPGITPEKHLGYAVQWFALALALAIIYIGVNTRRAGSGRHDEANGR